MAGPCETNAPYMFTASVILSWSYRHPMDRPRKRWKDIDSLEK